jgi:EmrB/QacA subfamily drug resistance transporter
VSINDQTTAPSTRGVAAEGARSSEGEERRRLTIALGVIVACQLMVIVDGTIVNVALPSIQRGLGFSPSDLAWVQSAYSLAFGGLLLLGGRAGDAFGRLRMFIGGMAVFTAASLLAGLAWTAGVLVAARVVQGAGAAFAAPASLSLLAATFREGPERVRALGVFSMVAGLGLTIGLILGGMLTTASWRWVFIINIPVGLATMALARPFLRETPRHFARFDIGGAILSIGAVTSLVYGFIHASSDGWSDPLTEALFAAGAALLVGFIAQESRASRPIMPLGLFGQRVRAGAYTNMLILSGGLGSTFFFSSIFLQDVAGFGPLRTGVAFLPMALTQFTCARLAPRLVPRFGPKAITTAGVLPILASGIWLTQLTAHSPYLTHVLGPLILLGAGVGLAFMPLNMVILAAVPPRDTGSASGLLQCMQQIGIALGIAVLTTVYGTTLRDHAHAHPGDTAPAARHEAIADGVANAFVVTAILFACALLVATLVIKARKPPTADPDR